MLRLVGRPDLVEQPWFSSARERVAHVDELDGAVQAWIAERDLDTVVDAFERARRCSPSTTSRSSSPTPRCRRATR